MPRIFTVEYLTEDGFQSGEEFDSMEKAKSYAKELEKEGIYVQRVFEGSAF